MTRLTIAVAVAAMLLAACSDDGGETTPTTTEAPATTSAPATTDATPQDLLTGPLQVGLFVISDVPELWRMAGAPPEGSELAIYAPSDNNATAERLLLKTVPLDTTASTAELVEDAVNDLEEFYDVVFVTQTVTTEIGFDDNPAQRIDFNWNQGFETGTGYRWVIPGQTEVVYATYLADMNDPELYLEAVEIALESAAVGG